MRIALVVPYFGKFPDNFQTVLNSCKYNDDLVDWLFFTDDRKQYDFPPNCKVFYCSFDELKQRIQKLYDFKISLNRPYKLCDYKPAYGHIFAEELRGYDYWGHCDIDCIFGKLSNFFNKDILKYDRILRLGHLCLYKNSSTVNKRYMLPVNNVYRYKEVFKNEDNCIFDECNVKNDICIDTIWEHYDFSRLYLDNIIANIYYKLSKFTLLFQVENSIYKKVHYKNMMFFWEKGNLYLFRVENDKLIKEEFAYIHFMKRKMKLIGNNSSERFKIVPNSFIEIDKLPNTVNEFNNEKKIYFTNQFFISRFNNAKVKLKRYIRDKRKSR